MWLWSLGGCVPQARHCLYPRPPRYGCRYFRKWLDRGRTQAEATLGPFGRTIELDVNLSNRGAGTSHAVAFSQGAFVGVSAQGAVVGARLAGKFYGVDVTPRQILLDEHAVRIPHEWRPLMDDVYAKLIALTSRYEDEDDDAVENSNNDAQPNKT